MCKYVYSILSNLVVLSFFLLSFFLSFYSSVFLHLFLSLFQSILLLFRLWFFLFFFTRFAEVNIFYLFHFELFQFFSTRWFLFILFLVDRFITWILLTLNLGFQVSITLYHVKQSCLQHTNYTFRPSRPVIVFSVFYYPLAATHCLIFFAEITI